MNLRVAAGLRDSPEGGGHPMPSDRSVHHGRVAVGIAIGVGIGTALGVALGNVAMGVALGAAAGVALGAILARRRR